MPGIALDSAKKGRLRPSFFFCLTSLVMAMAQAQQPVYRCGQEYTNAPADVARCERVATQSITVIPGTRVQGGPQPGLHTAPVPAAALLPQAPVPQAQRDDMARGILSAELDKARQRHEQLQQEYRQGEPVRLPDEMQSPHKYRDRMLGLRAAIERSQRDIDSLQRELQRRPAASATP